jgi:hypothetical protein
MSPSGRFCTFVNITGDEELPGSTGRISRITPLSLEAEDDNPHILGPAVTGDNHVLADYLSNICDEVATRGGRLSDCAAAIGVRNVGCGSGGSASVTTVS